MKIAVALNNLGCLVLSYHKVEPGQKPAGPYTLRALLVGGMASLEGSDILHPVSSLVLNETFPVDFDDARDPDCPTTGGAAVLSALSNLGIPSVESDQTHEPIILVWEQDDAKKIEQRMEQMGWKIVRTRPWKKP